MAYQINRKLVVGVSTNALFNMEKEDEIYRKHGIEAYKSHQIKNQDVLLEKGRAFPFIRRFLNINNIFPAERPVEVVLLSKNSPETGLRALNSIREYGLDISRAAFTSGRSPYVYIPAYNVSLYLSTNEADVKSAIASNYPAGYILNTSVKDDTEDRELRIAFDFDGVLANDQAEKIYQETKSLEQFHEHEVVHSEEPLPAGLMKNFLQKLSFFQKLESRIANETENYEKVLRTSIITARSMPAHKRAINTLRSWEIDVDEMIFLGGIEKRKVLEAMKPHLFIDDQMGHLDSSLTDIPLVHIPFGVINETKD